MKQKTIISKPAINKISILLISALGMQSCATTGHQGQQNSASKVLKETFNSDDPCANSKRNLGAILGGIAGIVIAKAAGSDNKLLAATLGAGIGALIGADIDKRQCELSRIQKKFDANIQSIPIKMNVPAEKNTQNITSNTSTVGLSVNVIDKNGDPQFRSGSDSLSTNASQMFTEIAAQYKPPKVVDEDTKKSAAIYKLRRVLLIGHTDDTGNTGLNADLSERRAQNVAKVFNNAGVPIDQIFYQGAGETLPLADNQTEEGRAVNRRVEIVDLSDDDTFQLYLQNRRAKTEFYRPISTAQNQDNINSVNISTSSKSAKNKVGDKAAVSIGNVANNGTSIKKNKTSDTKQQKPVHSEAKKLADQVANSNAIDFGGIPLKNQTSIVSIGNVKQNKESFSLISEAQASDLKTISTCNMDRPRQSGSVKSLRDGKAYSTASYLPGVYDSSWAGTVNGHLVALTHVAVLRDGGVPIGQPNLMIYQHYNPNSKKAPNYNSLANVNTYQGDKALLYRVFGTGPVQCVDIVIPNSNPREAPNSSIVYKKDNELYSSEFSPKLAKK